MIKLKSPFGIEILINSSDIEEIIIDRNLKTIHIYRRKGLPFEVKYDAEHLKKLEALEKNG